MLLQRVLKLDLVQLKQLLLFILVLVMVVLLLLERAWLVEVVVIRVVKDHG